MAVLLILKTIVILLAILATGSCRKSMVNYEDIDDFNDFDDYDDKLSSYHRYKPHDIAIDTRIDKESANRRQKLELLGLLKKPEISLTSINRQSPHGSSRRRYGHRARRPAGYIDYTVTMD